MSDIALKIMFENESASESYAHAIEMKRYLLEAHKEVSVDIQRSDVEDMDLGAILSIVSGIAAIFSIANGIKSFLEKNKNADLKIYKNGEILIDSKGIRGKDVPTIVKIIKGDKV